MITTILTTRIPTDATQRTSLRKFFSDPDFILFKEMVASRCLEMQTKAMHAMLYPSEHAIDDTGIFTDCARTYRDMLETIDSIEKDEEEWYTVKLERR